MTCSMITIPAYATIDEEKNYLDSLQEKKEDVQSIIDTLEKDKNDIQIYINKLDAEVSSISSELYKTGQTLVSVEKKISKNEKKLKNARKSITEQYASMKLRIQYMYENGNQEMFRMILSSESIEDFLNKAEYISELSSYDRKMLDKMQKTKETIETTQEKLEEQESTLTLLKADQQQKKSDVQALVASRISYVVFRVWMERRSVWRGK